MDIIKKIIKAEDDFLLENGEEAKFLIISAADAGELAYEVAISMGIPEDLAYTHTVTNFRKKYLCVIFDPKFGGFTLK